MSKESLADHGNASAHHIMGELYYEGTGAAEARKAVVLVTTCTYCAP
jgi:hypothetical protein